MKCADLAAKKIAQDENGNAILLECGVGKGKVYFSTVAEYSDDNGVVELMKVVMARMAKENAKILCDNKNIAFTERVLSDGRSELHLINTSCASDEKVEFNLIVNKNGEKKIIKETLSPCEILRICI